MTDSLGRARERRAGVRRAMVLVERAVASPAPGRTAAWSDELGRQLQVLSDALDAHITATEGPSGLLADIESAAPRLHHDVDVARREHVSLRRQLDGLLASLPATDDAAVADIRDRVGELLTGLVRHRQHGADLVFDAYQVDIEAAD
jgi:hemerythrin HHE cation binding domain-containing protein